MADANEEIEALKGKIKALEEELARLKDQCPADKQELIDKITGLEKEVADLKDEVEALKEENSKLKDEVAKLTEDNKAKDETIKDLEDKNNEKDQTIKDLEDEKAKIEKDLEDEKISKEEADKKIDELNDKIEELEKNQDTRTDADKTDITVPKVDGVEDFHKPTAEEKDKIKDAVIEENKDKLPEGTEVEVDDKGDVTITYPDKSQDTITADELEKASKGEEDKKSQADETEVKVPSVDDINDFHKPSKEEKDKIKDAILEENKDNFPKGTDVIVKDNGDAEIIFPDGSKKVITADELEKASKKNQDNKKSQAEEIQLVVPKVDGIKDFHKPTTAEKEKIKNAVIEANKNKLPKGTKVEVMDNGDVKVTFPDKSVKTITADELAKAAKSGSNLANGGKVTSTGEVGKGGKLPQTGEAILGYLASIGAIVGGAFGLKKKKRDDK